MKSSLQKSKLFKLLLLSTLFHGGLSVIVDLFENINYGGTSHEVEATRCTHVHNDWASSLKLKSGSCVMLFEDSCCNGKSIQIEADTDNLVTLDFNDKLTAISPCGDYLTPFPSSKEEKWLGHSQNISKVFEDGDVAIYYNSDMRHDALHWHQDYLKKMWIYVKSVYGYFGPEGGRMLSVFHANAPSDPYRFNSQQNYFDGASDCRNLLDMVGSNPDSWTGGQHGVGLDIITHEMAHIVEGASKGIHGSPSYSLWGDSKWAEIFIYDVYDALDLTTERDRWFNQMQNSKDNFPRPGTQWFKNWFFPIYEQHGGAELLNNYFEMLATHFPRKANGWQYSRDINLGEFVHFFSGAARADLKSQAEIAFRWDDAAEAELQRAKSEFHEIQY